MAKARLKRVIILLTVILLGGTLGPSTAKGQPGEIEKVRFATVVPAPPYAMPLLAAEEKGLWKKNGLEVKWFSMNGPAPTFQAAAAGAIDMGMSDVASFTLAASRGVPVLMVADLQTFDNWNIWVRAEGPIKETKDLKGARIGTTIVGSAPRAYAKILLEGAGLTERDVKIVGLESLGVRVAMLKAGHIDAYVTATLSEMPLKVKGEIRVLISTGPLLPKDWMMHVLFSHKGFAGSKPKTVKTAVKAFLEAAEFVQANREWTVEKLKSFSRYPQEAARETFSLMKYGSDGKINRKGLENVVSFLTKYGVISKENVPALDKLYTVQFTE